MNASKPNKIIIPNAAPIPIPALAPVESPDEALAAGAAVGVEVPLDKVLGPGTGDDNAPTAVVECWDEVVEEITDFDDPAACAEEGVD
jgi:hypothetical protein